MVVLSSILPYYPHDCHRRHHHLHRSQCCPDIRIGCRCSSSFHQVHTPTTSKLQNVSSKMSLHSIPPLQPTPPSEFSNTKPQTSSKSSPSAPCNGQLLPPCVAGSKGNVAWACGGSGSGVRIKKLLFSATLRSDARHLGDVQASSRGWN
jgi:hypothetical protein